MASVNYVVQKLSAAGLTVDVDGDFILCEDPDLNFERSHDGVRGVASWLKETLDEYEVAVNDLLNEDKDEERAIEFAETQAAIDEEVATWTESEQRFQANLELAEIAREEERLTNEAEGPMDESPYPNKEEPVNYVEHFLSVLGLRAQEPAEELSPPEKGHRLDQLVLARELSASMMSPKELWQAQQNATQDRGGIPNPEDYIRDMKLGAMPVAVVVKGQTFQAPKGWKIQERRPSGTVLFYASILQEHKAKNQARGAEFALVRA